MFSIRALAERFGGKIIGDGECQVSAVASLENAGPGEITFLANRRYLKFLKTSRAAAVILAPRDSADCPITAWVVDSPYATYARVAQLLYPTPAFEAGIHSSAVVGAGCSIAPTTYIGAQCSIGAGVTIADGCWVGPGCIIDDGCQLGADSRLIARVTLCRDSEIGARALIHPGVVIGADGFGFANDQNEWVKIPQIGGVSIGNDVEIGANTTIDRGALDNTIIEDGVKLDNLIQIAHNVRIGAHTAIASSTAIAGSATIGQRCAIGGCVGIVGHLTVADDVHITGMSFVTASIEEPGVYSSGVLIDTNRQWRRNAVRFKQLDDMAHKISHLENAVFNKK